MQDCEEYGTETTERAEMTNQREFGAYEIALFNPSRINGFQ